MIMAMRAVCGSAILKKSRDKNLKCTLKITKGITISSVSL